MAEVQLTSGLVGPTTTHAQLVTQSRSWDAEVDTNALFCRHTVEEVRQIAQRTRLDIERKKEDLRQMVGERYRDLIDAADSIVDMKTFCGHVVHSVSQMAHQCQQLQQTHLVKGSGGLLGPPTQSETHSLAARVKLLADTPEEIWCCLESQRYLHATHHFLLAQHVFSLLGGGAGGGARPGPAVQRLWHSIKCFKATILQCCRQHLQSSEEGEEAMVHSLCAIVLLEACSLRQAFAQFLLARKAAVQAVFHPSRQGHRSVRVQVCQAVGVVWRSLSHVSTIFCGRDTPSGLRSPPLLLKVLQEFAAGKQTGFVSPLHAGTSELPRLHTRLSEILPADIHSSCEEWITTCVEDMERGVGSLLQHVTSVKALASIRAAVHNLLLESADAAPPARVNANPASEWLEICQRVLGRELSIWNTFLCPLLFSRAKAILSGLFLEAGSHSTATLGQLLAGMEEHPSRYAADCHASLHLWQEDSHPSATQGNGIDTLRLKARACTPSVYSFCQSFGAKLEEIIQDASHYLRPESQLHVPAKKVVLFPFDLYGDSSAMHQFLQHSTTDCISRFLAGVDERVSEVRGQEGGAQARAVDRLLVVGRICQSLVECCPALARLSVGCRKQEPATPGSLAGGRAHRLLSHNWKREAEAEKNPTSEMLQQRALTIYRVWVEWCAKQCRLQFQEQLSSEMELSALSSTLAWQRVTIAEEAESGKQVSSEIQVPAQASVYVTALLFGLCQEISRIGGHAVHRSILLELGGRVLRGILGSYRTLLQDLATMPQNCALQLLFNLHFLARVLPGPKDSETGVDGEVKGLAEQLQAFVDPFDLDVFLPHILSNLERQLQRSAVLLGLLLALRGPVQLGTHRAPSGSAQEKHVVIPLVPSMARLHTLPISSPLPQPLTKHAQITVAEPMLTPSFLATVSFCSHV